MYQKNKQNHDKYRSTFAWRILVKPEEDTRKFKKGDHIISGYSKYLNADEPDDKEQLLLDCCSMLFEQNWIRKSNGILLYKSDNGIMLDPLTENLRIAYFDTRFELITLKVDGDAVSSFANRVLLKMFDKFNIRVQSAPLMRVV